MFSQHRGGVVRGVSDESRESAGTTGECRAIMFLQISHLFGFMMCSGESERESKKTVSANRRPASILVSFSF